jgi:hypothetical protein
MAESFGNSFTVVQVTGDDTKTQIWIAVAKPSQAVTLVLAAAPERVDSGSIESRVDANQQRMFEELNLEPGDVHGLDRAYIG